MKKSLTLFAAFTVLVSFELKSIIANPNPIIKYDVNGNKVTLVLHGDESSKYAIVEENGMFAEVDSIGRWWYIELEKNDQIKISEHEVSASDVNSVKNELCIQIGTIMLREEMMKQDKRRRSIQYFRNSTSQEAVVGRRNALIVLAQFPDQNIICEQADFERLFNQPNYSENSATGSVYDYFYEISEGQLEIASNIIGPFMAKHPMSYYGANTGIGGNDTNPFALFSEAMEFAASSVNLSDYDCNGDGFIDNIHIIYAGYGEESGAPSNTIWAHEATFSPITINAELKIDRYSCSPELRGRSGNLITTIGPPCHEILHALGAMDFYDTDYSTNGQYSGTGSWDIMASGSWNNGGATPAWPNPYIRAYNMGWTNPIILEEDNTYKFPKDDTKRIYRIDNEEANDFFLLEYRNNKYFSSAEPGKGIMIFHIGPEIDSRAGTNTINAKYPQQCYPVCSMSTYKYPNSNPDSYGDIDSPECPFTDTVGRNEFSSSTTPEAGSISGMKSKFSISSITIDSTDESSFKFKSGYNNESNTTLWNEDFERSPNINDWRQKNIVGKSTWTLLHNVSSSESNAYISLSGDDDKLNPRTVKSAIYSPTVILRRNNLTQEIQKKKFEFSAIVRCNSTEKSHCQFNFSTDDLVLHSFETDIEPNGEWTNITVPLPDEISIIGNLNIEIISTLCISNKSNIDIDNLAISQTTSEMSTLNIIDTDLSEDEIVYYNLSGMRVCKENLSSGLYIMKKGSKYKKVYIPPVG